MHTIYTLTICHNADLSVQPCVEYAHSGFFEPIQCLRRRMSVGIVFTAGDQRCFGRKMRKETL